MFKEVFLFWGIPRMGFIMRILALLDLLGGVIISCSIVVCGVVLKDHRLIAAAARKMNTILFYHQIYRFHDHAPPLF